METLTTIVLTLLITLGACWLLSQLVSAVGGHPSPERLAGPRGPDTPRPGQRG